MRRARNQLVRFEQPQTTRFVRRPLPCLFAFHHPAWIVFGRGDFEVVDLEAAYGFADERGLWRSLL